MESKFKIGDYVSWMIEGRMHSGTLLYIYEPYPYYARLEWVIKEDGTEVRAIVLEELLTLEQRGEPLDLEETFRCLRGFQDYMTAQVAEAITEEMDKKALEVEPSNVKHPNHYQGKIETWDYVVDKLTPEELRGAIKFNIIKYASREAKKNGNEDLLKIHQYLSMYLTEIGVLKK